jgi:serine/threonine-protein kinase
MREAYILSRLKSPYIPAVCDIEEMEHAFYIIEEYIDGKSLYDYIRENGIFEQEKGFEIGVKLAKIIDFLHSGHSFMVCHLDIQPKNILIKDEQVYLIDFGNALSSKNSGCDAVMATEGFAPPEQYVCGFGADMSRTALADIYGFGAVLLYMMTGVYKKVSDTGEVTRLLEEKGIDGQMKKVILMALEKHSDCRQNSMGIICRQMESSYTGLKNTQDGEQYIISVAGLERGCGATYTAILLTVLLKSRGIDAIYEENHLRDTVRLLAKAYEQVEYENGCFVLGGIKLKPKYNTNIRLDTKCSVIVRDEGSLKEKNGGYGDYLVITSYADIIGMAVLKDGIERISKMADIYGKNISVILNGCSLEQCRKTAGVISCADGYIPYAGTPFCADIKEHRGLWDILEKILAELKKGDGGYEKEHRAYTDGRNSKHWHSFRKKG